MSRKTPCAARASRPRRDEVKGMSRPSLGMELQDRNRCVDLRVWSGQAGFKRSQVSRSKGSKAILPRAGGSIQVCPAEMPMHNYELLYHYRTQRLVKYGAHESKLPAEELLLFRLTHESGAVRAEDEDGELPELPVSEILAVRGYSDVQVKWLD